MIMSKMIRVSGLIDQTGEGDRNCIIHRFPNDVRVRVVGGHIALILISGFPSITTIAPASTLLARKLRITWLIHFDSSDTCFRHN